MREFFLSPRGGGVRRLGFKKSQLLSVLRGSDIRAPILVHNLFLLPNMAWALSYLNGRRSIVAIEPLIANAKYAAATPCSRKPRGGSAISNLHPVMLFYELPIVANRNRRAFSYGSIRVGLGELGQKLIGGDTDCGLIRSGDLDWGRIRPGGFGLRV